MTFVDALSLGRVSNLPTVWTNLLAGLVLAAGTAASAATSAVTWQIVVLLAVSLTLFYIGGMYLNDAFDAEIDARERPERPIPGGRVGRGTVFGLGFGMLALGVALLYFAGRSAGTGHLPVLGGLGLAGCIVAYDAWHKANPISPFIMGLCRMLVYVTAGYCVTAALPEPLWIGAVLLLCYLIGLTYVAKQENLGEVKNMWPLVFLAAPVVYGIERALGDPLLWAFVAILTAWVVVALYFVRRRGPGDIPRAVVSLIAGMCLVDALLIAQAGQPGLAVVAIVGFGLTLALQRFIAGT